MGCCAPKIKFETDIPFKKLEKYKNLKLEIEQFLSNKDLKEKMNSHKILDLLIKATNELSECKEEFYKLKRLKKINLNISDELLDGISQDIKTLKEYHIILNNLLKESENYFDNQIEKVNEDYLRNENNIYDIKKKEDSSILSSEKNIKNENIYFKKYIRRNKKRIVNQNRNNNKINNARTNFINNYENKNEQDKNNELLTNENIPLDINNDLNLIFELENGKRILLHAKPEEKFLNVVKKLGEKEADYDNIENIIFFDEEKDINEKILNGEKVEDFGLTDFHLIQAKIKKDNLL